MPSTAPQTWGDIAYAGSYIAIYRQPKTRVRKTDLFVVVTKQDQTEIADIRWYAPWRRYVLLPRPNTVWESVCLTEIGLALGDLTAAYKARH
jgi:hypothetical protein